MRALLVAFLLFAAVSAHAESAAVEVADNPTSGRLIFHLAGSKAPIVIQRGTKVQIRLPIGEEVSTPDLVPRNVVSFSGEGRVATIILVPGALIKTSHQGNLLIADLLDPRFPGPAAASRVATGPNPSWSAPASPAPAAMELTPPAQAPPPEQSPAAVQSLPPTEPASAGAGPPPAPAAPAPAAFGPLRIVAGPEVGAVAFRRGDLGIVVLDDEVGLAPGAEATLGPATLAHTRRGTVITMPLAEAQSIALARESDAWMVRIGDTVASPAVQTAVPDGIAFQFAQPGRVMTLLDPVTRQVLLLGTTRQAGGERAMIATRRSAPGYVLLPTVLGLALEPGSEAVDLRTSLSGFTLQVADRSAPGKIAPAVRESQFNIPTAPAAVLVRQLDAQIASAGSAPPRSRGPERIAAARTMLALGMSAEAEALLNLAADDDPVVAGNPAIAALSGVAAVLAGRPGEASGLDNSALPTDGEIALWRGLRDAALGKAALALASATPLLAAYPETIRRKIAPPVIEAAIKDGSPVPAASLEAPELAYARALQKDKAGEVEPALQAYDAIQNGHDGWDSVRAAVAAAELRLGTGRITPAAAADQIERQTVRWRGDGQELAIRLRAAELRTQAGQWRAALESLQQTEALFADTKARVVTMKTTVFKSLLAAKDSALNPLELVGIAGDFADCIPGGSDGERMAGLLADKLAALDLPSRAIPVLQRLVEKSDSPAAKSELALRLAQLQLDAGDPSKAETALASVDADALTPARVEQRALLLAKAKAGQGDPAGAAELLGPIESPAAYELRGALFAKAGDWRRSLQALDLLAAKIIPEKGELTEEQQDVVLRQATAAVQAGDVDALRKLKRLGARITAPRADLFRLLTATPVDSPEDLPRAARELAMSRSLPDRLDALKLR